MLYRDSFKQLFNVCKKSDYLQWIANCPVPQGRLSKICKNNISQKTFENWVKKSGLSIYKEQEKEIIKDDYAIIID